MTEAEWLSSTDPAAMLGHPGDRKLRLFACACVRQVWHLLTDDRSRRAVVIAERMADHQDGADAYKKRRQEAEYEAWIVPQQWPDDGPDDGLSAARQAALCASELAVEAANGAIESHLCVPDAAARAGMEAVGFERNP